MTRIAHRLVAVFMVPGHVRVRDHIAFRLRRLAGSHPSCPEHCPRHREAWLRSGRPGFRPSEYR